MSNGTNRRFAQRLPLVAPIRFSIAEEEDYRNATLYNYSATGMYLEMQYPPPKLGAHLLIEVLDRPQSEHSGPESKSTSCYYAKVIWKKNLPTATHSKYGVGVVYLENAPE